ncbi:MAG: hypothetical protein CMH65_13910 [Nevskiales bacterium]|nr:hypothetical protein [Nevskiales bacterium]
MRNAQWAAGLAACGLMSLAGCGGSIGSDQGDNPPVGAAPTYDATIVRDSDGVPHITGADYGDIGYGYGYVHAEDNLCVLAEDLITTLGRRAEFFGRDGSYSIPANGNTSNNVDSDFFWRHMQIEERVAALRADASPEAAAATAGFAAGYSRYVRELQAGEHPGRHAACRDAGWVTPITADDVYRRYFRLAIIASSSALVTEIGAAQPPLPGQTTPAVATDREQFPLQGGLPIGSNMYALSGEATQTGQSMLFGNPHFPWEGTERLYQAHMTIPGELDIMGASLYGVPAALIGFNRHVAWSHTVSTAYRFGLYELTLVPGNPTSYLFDGEAVEMESETYSIQVLETDGSLTEESRTLYRSHYGPMMSLSVSGIPVLGWDVLRAYTLRDANAENTRMINQFFAWNRAESLDDFIQKQKDILGVPWVNTAATGPGEPAYYADITVVPNVSDDKVTQCQSLLGPVVGALMPGLPVLRGSSSDCDWDSDADAPAPGIFGPGNLPSLLRDDWVHNCNDSYWLTHPDEPITGYAAIIGDEGSERSLRTRLCIRQVQDRLDGSDGRPGTGFADLAELQDIVLSSALMTERLARQTVLDSICPLGTILSSSLTPVDVSGACAVLAAWDGSLNLESVGGHIWREFWKRADDALLPLWLSPFDTSDPVNTPNTLNPLNPQVVAALADAVEALEQAGVALDAPLGALQVSAVHDQADPVPVFGGNGFEGAFTIAARGELVDARYPVTYGNSYIQTVTWDDNGDPIAEGFVTYSQSTDPASPYFQNMTEAYADKAWIPWRFTEAQLAADAGRSSFRVSE